MIEKNISKIILNDLSDLLRLVTFIDRESKKDYLTIFYKDNFAFYITDDGLILLVEDAKIRSRFALLNIFEKEKIIWKRKFTIYDPLTSRLFLFIELPEFEIIEKSIRIKLLEAMTYENLFKVAISTYEPLLFYSGIFYFGLIYFKKILGKEERIIVYKKTDIELNKESRYLMLTEDGNYVFREGIDRVLPFTPIISLKNEL